MKLKKLGKKMLMFCLTLSLILTSSLAVFANGENYDLNDYALDFEAVGSIEDYKVTVDGQEYTVQELLEKYPQEEVNALGDVTANSTYLVDNQTIYETISGAKVYNINVNSPDARRIFIGSLDPIKVLIICPSLSNFVAYDSGYFRHGVKVSWNFIPGMEYQLIVLPQSGSTNVDVTMTPTLDSSWVTYSSYTIEQKNLLLGNQVQLFDLAFLNNGTYRITISTGIDMLAATVRTSLGYNESVLLRGNSHSFIIQGRATGNMLDHQIILHNLMQPNVGAGFTVTIERLY